MPYTTPKVQPGSQLTLVSVDPTSPISSGALPVRRGHIFIAGRFLSVTHRLTYNILLEQCPPYHLPLDSSMVDPIYYAQLSRFCRGAWLRRNYIAFLRGNCHQEYDLPAPSIAIGGDSPLMQIRPLAGRNG